MKKNFLLKFILFAVIGAFVTMTSCKDYDGDIKELNTKYESLSAMKTDLGKGIEDVKAQVTTLQKSADDAKKAADAAKAVADAAKTAADAGSTAADVAKKAADAAATAAGEAKAAATAAADAAKKAADAGKTAQETADAAKAAAAAAQKTADDALKAANEAKAKGAELEKELKALKTRIETLEQKMGSTVSNAEFEKLGDSVNKLMAQVQAFVGKRLLSITLIPTFHVNGIAAIPLRSLEYNPQSFNPKHLEYQFTTTGATITRTIDSKSTVVEFRLSPRYITKDDIRFPYFESFVSENLMTRTVKESNTGKNKPIAPVADQMLNITNEGILKLKVTKTVDEPVGHEITEAGDFYALEKFYMASLAIPVAEKYWTADEKESGKTPTITSEIYRIAEVTEVPRIKSTLALDETVQSWDPSTRKQDEAPVHYRPYSLDKDGKPQHYSDSTMLYSSGVNERIDKVADWQAGIDLKKLVTVCTERNHATLENYAEYGLEFRFALATEEYMQGVNNTDQQKFATIADAKEGFMKSRVYTIGGETQTAIGREPIIRVSLVNTRKNNELVDQRYIKIKWGRITPPKQLDPYTFKEQDVSCKEMINRFGTQEMNELIYRQVEKKWGISKEQFHDIYTKVVIKDFKKGNVFLIKDFEALPDPGLTFGSQPGRDVRFYMAPDNNDNTSYNLIWEMTPKAVGTIVPKTRETYTVTVVFKDRTNTNVEGDNNGLHGDIYMDFLADIVIPTQNFTYQGTYWKNGVGQGIFNVNPIVYRPQDVVDNGVTLPNHGYPTVAEFSHIEADLVNGYIYAPTEKKPANLAQFIQKIRGCANVKFIFDNTRFRNYDYLSGYNVDETKTSLWKKSKPVLPDDYEYINDKDLAATIHNMFGATATENYNKNLPYDEFNEQLQSGNNEASAIIRLHELNEKNGTEPAKGLIGKKVPVNLVVEYNRYNPATVQQFEVFFIEPLKVNGEIKDPLTDAAINGSFTSVETGFSFTDWNNYLVAKKKGYGPKDEFAPQLYDYYAVRNVIFDVENAKTSLKLVGDTYIHQDGVTTGQLPTNRSLKQVKITDDWPIIEYIFVDNDPTHLGYFNNNGTPVNVNYNIYVDVKVGYKWGELFEPAVEIKVNKAEGIEVLP